MAMVTVTAATDTREEATGDTEDTTARGRPSLRPLLLLRPTPRLMLMPTTEATMEAMAWAMVLAMLVLAMAMEDTDLATATEAMVDTVSDTTERERPRLRLVMARGGDMDTEDMDTEDMDTEPEDTTMARGRLRPRLATTRTGAMATDPEVTMVMAMDTVSTTDKRSDENCQSSIEFRC